MIVPPLDPARALKPAPLFSQAATLAHVGHLHLPRLGLRRALHRAQSILSAAPSPSAREPIRQISYLVSCSRGGPHVPSVRVTSREKPASPVFAGMPPERRWRCAADGRQAHHSSGNLQSEIELASASACFRVSTAFRGGGNQTLLPDRLAANGHVSGGKVGRGGHQVDQSPWIMRMRKMATIARPMTKNAIVGPSITQSSAWELGKPDGFWYRPAVMYKTHIRRRGPRRSSASATAPIPSPAFSTKHEKPR
jgi:hypothetical protein